MRAVQAPREQLPPLDLRRLRDLDLDRLTPLDALNVLARLKQDADG